MPNSKVLPESLRQFAFFNAVRVDVGPDFHAHVDRLIRSVDLRDPRRRSGGTAAVPRRAVLAGAGSTVALGLGGAVYILWPRPPEPNFAGTHRTALVIGNAQYRNVPPIGNPVRDADSVSAALEQRGFRVIKVIDADGPQTTEAVTDFERTLSVVGVERRSA
jgi:hypothetical protein